MESSDFLKLRALTPLCETYVAAGLLCEISTNSKRILEFARELFTEGPPRQTPVDIRLRFWVDAQARTAAPWPKPHFRGLGQLVFAGFDSANSLLVDLRTRRVIGRFAEPMASDRTYWKAIIFPMLLSVVAASSNVVELHCACVERRGEGLLLAGSSGSGKSTLSLALARNGFAFVSDDRTCISTRDGRLWAWPLSRTVKLRPDSLPYFPEIAQCESKLAWSPDRVFELNGGQPYRVSKAPCCEPRWIFFLEQQEAPRFELISVPPAEAAVRLESGLMQEGPEEMQAQRLNIRKLAELPCWILRYCGEPHEVAQALAASLTGPRPNPERSFASETSRPGRFEAKRIDPLRRFTATALAADLPVMDRMVRLETHSPIVLQQAQRIFERYRPKCISPQFLWRVAVDSPTRVESLWREVAAFSDNNLRYIHLGPRCFLAVDLESRIGVGFLPEQFAADEIGFSTVFLGDLFYLTAGVLRLTPVSAACVARGNKGLLLLGPPNSGKTTSSYLSAQGGFDFHADQTTFVDLKEGRLRAWGDFWPVAFRAETANFLPQLAAVTRRFEHHGFAFLCMNPMASGGDGAQPVTPVSCIFLERGVAKIPRLVPLSSGEFGQLLTHSAPFQDEERFEADRVRVLRALGELPGYRLLYGDDPAETVPFIRSLMVTHEL
jgi:DNA polymerase III delta prime subunit